MTHRDSLLTDHDHSADQSAGMATRAMVRARALLAPCLFIVASLCASANGWAARDGTSDAGSIVSAHGDTSLARTGEIVSPADRKPSLREGDRLRTGRDGRMELQFTDGMRMSLGPDTRLTISQYVLGSNDDRSWFDLARGTLRTITGLIGKRDPQSFRLRTPTAVVGVRGTDFTVKQADCPGGHCRSNAPTALSVRVDEGAVDVVGAAGQVTVGAGEAAVIGRVGEAPRLIAVTAVDQPILPLPIRPIENGSRTLPALPAADTGPVPTTPAKGAAAMSEPIPASAAAGIGTSAAPAEAPAVSAGPAPSLPPMREPKARPIRPTRPVTPRDAGDLGAPIR